MINQIKLCENCTKLNTHLEGKTVYIPRTNGILNKQIMGMLSLQLTPTQIGKALNVSRQKIQWIKKLS